MSEAAVEHILMHGVYHNDGKDRCRILKEDVGVVLDEKADYVLLTGCTIPERIPGMFHAVRNLLDYFGVSYTFLSKEHCCGWVPLLKPAVVAKDETKIEEMKQISATFIKLNCERAIELGARAIVTLCSACEPSYSEVKGTCGIQVMHYPEMILEVFEGGQLDDDVDYYPGCYRFRRRLTSVGIDYDKFTEILSRIEGLRVNPVDRDLCCFVPPKMEEIVRGVRNRVVVTTCTGCHSSLKRGLEDRKGHEVKMLPEVVWESLRKE